mmetsp:Transcript_8264/g.24851  ORF Transcript_8264/g.24851 Transcript_8264/m.24851 type:complete len:210 (+) Transcript_8264:85-714(+)
MDHIAGTAAAGTTSNRPFHTSPLIPPAVSSDAAASPMPPSSSSSSSSSSSPPSVSSSSSSSPNSSSSTTTISPSDVAEIPTGVFSHTEKPFTTTKSRGVANPADTAADASSREHIQTRSGSRSTSSLSTGEPTRAFRNSSELCSHTNGSDDRFLTPYRPPYLCGIVGPADVDIVVTSPKKKSASCDEGRFSMTPTVTLSSSCSIKTTHL